MMNKDNLSLVSKLIVEPERNLNGDQFKDMNSDLNKVKKPTKKTKSELN